MDSRGIQHPGTWPEIPSCETLPLHTTGLEPGFGLNLKKKREKKTHNKLFKTLIHDRKN